jgi:hypothetical protein
MYDLVEENKSDPLEQLVDYDYLKRVKNIFLFIGLINWICIVIYSIRFLYGGNSISKYNPNKNLENLIAKKVPYLNTLNCTESSESWNKYIFWENSVEDNKHMNAYEKIPLGNNHPVICGELLGISFIRNETFSQPCSEVIYLKENFCPISNIFNHLIPELIYDPNIVVNNNGDKFFVYVPKLLFTSNCTFIDEIKPEYISIKLPFLFLFFIGAGAFFLVFYSFVLEIETKDDYSRPPMSSTTETKHNKTGIIETYQEGRYLVKKRDMFGYVTRTRYHYHQINQTGKEKLLQFYALFVTSLICFGCLCNNSKKLWIYYTQVLLAKRIGEDECLYSEFLNKSFRNYGEGVDIKIFQMMVGIGFTGILNIMGGLISFIFIVGKVGLKKTFFFS